MSKQMVTLTVLLLAVIALWSIANYAVNHLPAPPMAQPRSARLGAKPRVSAGSVSSPTAPKEIKYDSSTDLKKELDSINPQVSDEDFE